MLASQGELLIALLHSPWHLAVKKSNGSVDPSQRDRCWLSDPLLVAGKAKDSFALSFPLWRFSTTHFFSCRTTATCGKQTSAVRIQTNRTFSNKKNTFEYATFKTKHVLSTSWLELHCSFTRWYTPSKTAQNVTSMPRIPHRFIAASRRIGSYLDLMFIHKYYMKIIILIFNVHESKNE